jgi:hypothetical protein
MGFGGGNEASKAKVSQPRRESPIEQNVAGFDVPVNDVRNASLVKIC